MAPKHFSSILGVKMLADDRGIHNASRVGHVSTYVKTRERGRIKDVEQRSRVYNAVHYNLGFFPWTSTTEL